ncbi:MAG: HD domain-containing protein [candidate division NC10 bacterium]|nr:HD domain-containing protein [candidate division NC10 bacterium]
MGRIFVQELKVGTTLDQPFLVKAKSMRQKKTGEPFLSLLVGDRTGEVSGNLWEDFEEAERTIEAGDFVRIRAFVGSFQGSPQLNIQSIQKLDPVDIDFREFCPSTERDVEEMVNYLRGVAASLGDPHLRTLLNGFLEDEDFLGKLKRSPAAKGLHHVYLGGLLEHTTSVVRICEGILAHYGGIHRDLLLAGAILHDVGKVEELNFERGIADYTDEGRLLGHIVLGSLLVKERILRIPGFPRALERELLHILISHHGEHAWGSPKRPKTVEALIVHHVEDLDAKVMGFQQFMSQSQDPQRPHWTLYHKTFERFLYLREEGRDLPGKERDAT